MFPLKLYPFPLQIDWFWYGLEGVENYYFRVLIGRACYYKWNDVL